MKVGVSFGGEVIVDYQVDSFNIDTSAEEIGGNQKSWSVGFEKVVIFDSFLLFELGVNADRIEKFLSEEFCKFFGSVNSVDEDDHLIEGQSVKKMC